MANAHSWFPIDTPPVPSRAAPFVSAGESYVEPNCECGERAKRRGNTAHLKLKVAAAHTRACSLKRVELATGHKLLVCLGNPKTDRRALCRVAAQHHGGIGA